MLPSGMWWSNTPMFDIFFIHFGLLAPKDFKVLGFLFLWSWPTCWRLFRQRVKCAKFNIYGFIGRNGVKHLDHNLSINCLIVDDDTSTRRPDLMSSATDVYTNLISLVSDALCAVCGKMSERKCPKLCITDSNWNLHIYSMATCIHNICYNYKDTRT